MEPGHTAKRGEARLAGHREPKVGSVHNKDRGMESIIAAEMRRKAQFDPGTANLSKIEEGFVERRSGSQEDLARALKVVKKVRKLHKAQGVKI